jgi:subtilisin family serine protease
LSRPVARPVVRRALVVVAAVALALPASASAAEPTADGVKLDHAGRTSSQSRAGHTGQIIVRYRSGVGSLTRTAVRQAVGATLDRALPLIDAQVVEPAAGTFAHTLAALRRDPHVLWAQPNRRLNLDVDPSSEELYVLQWGHENTGLRIPYPSGTPGIRDIDVDGNAALFHTDGSGVVVAVIDDGVDGSHPDLADQLWTNPDESGGGKETNGVDDDGNGFVDDVHGWDFCNDDNSLHDNPASPDVELPDYHGTAVAGTIAAAVNTSGMAGIAPGAQIMGLKFLVAGEPDDGDICSDDAHAIEAIDYAAQNGADIINASWGGPDDGPALDDAIEAAGILFVTSAGNGGLDGVGDNIDVHPVSPGSSTVANVLTVGANDNRGRLTTFTNYGPTSVDLMAPGKDVVVTVPEDYDPNFAEDLWYYFDGTSFSAPYTAGVAALVLSENPSLSPTELRAQVIQSGTKLAAAAGKTVSGRMLNARNALDVSPPTLGLITARPTPSSTLGASVARTRISWAPATENFAIDYYRVRMREGTGAWQTVVGSTLERTVDVNLRIGRNYEFELFARDRGGNTATRTLPVKTYRYQEAASQATYSGSWTSAQVSSASGGRLRYSSRANASVTFDFFGKSAGLVAPLSPAGGRARVYVDGVYETTISFYSSSSSPRRIVYSRSWATGGSHSLKLIVLGTGSHPRVSVDALVFHR